MRCTRHLGRRFVSVLALTATLAVADHAAAQPQNLLCVSVFVYGGAASGWLVNGAGAHPAGSLRSMEAHVLLANDVLAQADIKLFWAQAVIYLDDHYGAHNGDIEGIVASDRVARDSNGNTGIVSRDIDRILRDVADSECYPIVFVNGLSGAAGLTIGDTLNVAPFVNDMVGKVTLIDSDAFPKPDITPSLAREDKVSTLAHEMGHALCLDPTVANWGDTMGHPIPDGNNPTPGVLGTGVCKGGANKGVGCTPANCPGATCECASMMCSTTGTLEGGGTIPVPNATPQRFYVMWFIGDERTGDELLSPREQAYARACLGPLRARWSPSFSVAPGTVANLDDDVILWAPAQGTRPPDLGFLTLGEGLDALSYGNDFGRGRFVYNFSVDLDSDGEAGTAVAGVASGNDGLQAGSEFGGPARPVKNELVLFAGQLGLNAGDVLDALIEESPALPAVPTDAFGPPDEDLDGVLDAGERVYFSVPAGALTLDPGHVYVVTGGPPQLIAAYVQGRVVDPTQPALGLAPGDDIDALCVKDDGNGIWDGPPKDLIRFSLSRNSPSVQIGLSAAEVFEARFPFGFEPVTRAQDLGLLNGDDLTALKCHEPPLDHFLWYKAKPSDDAPRVTKKMNVDLEDQFGLRTHQIIRKAGLLNPAEKNGQEILEPGIHLTAYQIRAVTPEPVHVTNVTNQFGPIGIATSRAQYLLVPANKDPGPRVDPLSPPDPLEHDVDHFKCYHARVTFPQFKGALQVTVKDQFGPAARTFFIRKPKLLCTPTDKNAELRKSDTNHLLCYPAKPAAPIVTPKGVYTADQFIADQVDVGKEHLLCVPSLKLPFS
ncbi:MAG TPA: hypothetical protein VKA21_01335 [Candidatus Binatia bacterium]|nr:hypothetical protein [Candidatus Binatia bacterium]